MISVIVVYTPCTPQHSKRSSTHTHHHLCTFSQHPHHNIPPTFPPIPTDCKHIRTITRQSSHKTSHPRFRPTPRPPHPDCLSCSSRHWGGHHMDTPPCGWSTPLSQLLAGGTDGPGCAGGGACGGVLGAVGRHRTGGWGGCGAPCGCPVTDAEAAVSCGGME